jgi:FlaA1/EpsC-like NDP-sugar epimerase
MKSLNLDKFIAEKVVNRPISLLAADLEKFDHELHKKIDGKSVLVIGGAGTIGSSYIKAILKFNVKRLFVVDINENGLTELVRDIRSSIGYNIPKDFITYPVNFGDPVFEKILVNEGPFEIVANFAAHKHVRSEKDEYSIEAMIDNNVFKAKKLLELLLLNKPEHFFCVSTDKAANPVNIMGASKKLMEEVIMTYSDSIHIVTARFANVAFSNGSLPLGFLERFNKKQPWSCPSDIKRFFVSPQESGQICLIASILGESGDIFFPKLDMVNDMKPFTLIVEALLKEYGLDLDLCKSEDEARQKALQFSENSVSYPVYYFNSDTSGEKAYEEFYTEQEKLDMGTFINLGVVKNTKARTKVEIEKIFNNLQNLFSHRTTKSELIETLKRYLPNFEHIETGKNLDQKM